MIAMALSLPLPLSPDFIVNRPEKTRNAQSEQVTRVAQGMQGARVNDVSKIR